jgi:Zn-dependent oligopeptidase
MSMLVSFTCGSCSSLGLTIISIRAKVSLSLVFLRRFERTICLDKQDVTALWNDLREQVSLVKGGKRSAGQGSFGHIVGGYDAGYYG